MATTAAAAPTFLVVLIIFFLAICPACGRDLTKQRCKALTSIKKINGEGPYVGLITTYPPEEDAFFSIGVFEPNPRHPYVDLSGRRFRVGKIHDKKVIYVKSGIGTANAAAVTQQLLDFFDVMGIVHFGICGNTNDSMSVGDVTIPKQFANTGLWDWLKPNATLPTTDIAAFEFGEYNEGESYGRSPLGLLGFHPEELFSITGRPNSPTSLFWAPVNEKWLQLAMTLEGTELEQCLNSSLCVEEKPKVVVGLNGSTANIYLDNAAYRDFLFRTFQVSSVDTESSAVLMTGLSNGFLVIVLRGLSDLAGGQAGNNTLNVFGPLAALNVAKVVVQFVQALPAYHHINK